MGNLSEKRLFLLDMDGTIYLDDTLFDGTAEFLQHVKAIGGRYLFLTNNSSRGIHAYLEKMARLGIPAEPADFLTSVDVTIGYLQAHYPGKLCYASGTKTFRQQLAEAGIGPEFIRFSVGIEDVRDILADLGQALDQI